MDLVRPLGLAGISCAVVTQPGSPSVYSRFTRAALYWKDFSEGTEELVDALVRFGAAQPEPPVLFYAEDSHLLLVSRHRHSLKAAFRFVLGDEQLIEDLVDKKLDFKSWQNVCIFRCRRRAGFVRSEDCLPRAST